jgi:hypothetical protein
VIMVRAPRAPVSDFGSEMGADLGRRLPETGQEHAQELHGRPPGDACPPAERGLLTPQRSCNPAVRSARIPGPRPVRRAAAHLRAGTGPEHPDTLTTRANRAHRTGAAGDVAGARDQSTAPG